MFKKGLHCFLIFVLLVSSTSCATIVSGRNQNLPVITEPSGAIVTVGTYKQVSPATFVLDRKQAMYVVKVEKEGYESVEIALKKSVNGWVWGNILFGIIGGAIGLTIDISTGSASKFTPNEVEVNLVKQQLGLSDKDLKNKDIIIVKLIESEPKQ